MIKKESRVIQMLPIIPFPNQIEIQQRTVEFFNYRISVDSKFSQATEQFQKDLQQKLISDSTKKAYLFNFKYSKKLKKEQYQLDIQDDECNIYSKTKIGFYYACKTLSQLLYLNTNGSVYHLKMPCLSMNDQPRFSFRSCMIDECRHFFGKEEIKKIIDLLSDLKFNYFHWHLSDDQGFRIHFKEFEELKLISSKRSKTKINNTEDDAYDETLYAYCYELDDIKEVIEYAKQRFIEIIPEIDMPGHTTAIVAAHPELHCFNKKVEVETNFGVFYDILCPGKEQSYVFAKKLLKALCDLFKDSRYIHIGGDEVDPKNWNQCPDCQKKMNELETTDPALLQNHFMNEMITYLQSLGKKVICWHDGVEINTNQDVIMQYWTWKMDEKRIDFANQGRKTIYSPCSQFYFNDPYAELPLKNTYCKKITLEHLSRKGLSSFIGIEGCIWTEWIDNNELLEVLLIPRLQALAEKAWTKNKSLNFKDFLDRLEAHHAYLDYKNFSYASTKLALAKGKQYRQKIALSFRGNDKKVEYKLYLKQKKKSLKL